MAFQDWIQNFKRNFCNYAEYEKEITFLQTQRNSFIDTNEKLKRESFEKDAKLISLNKKYDESCKDVESLAKELKEEGLTPVDIYCQNKGYRVNNFVYKDKVIINGIKIPCNLREMITPNSYVVESIRKSISKPDNTLLWYQRIMNKVYDLCTWTDDGRDDNYYYPAYSLTIKKCDCDDFAFAQCSIEPELGTAFGFWDRDNNRNLIGHAWAVGIIDDELWIFDAVPNQSVKAEKSAYSISYIITQNSIYIVDGSTDFGVILWS